MEPKLKVGQQVTLKGGEIVSIVSVELRGGSTPIAFMIKMAGNGGLKKAM